LVRERDEAEYLLNQQRRFLTALEQFARPGATPLQETGADAPQERSAPASTAVGEAPKEIGLPVEFDEYYQELLRTYVIRASGNLAAEIVKLAEVLSQAAFAPREVLDLHLARVERLVRGLGNRSTRHVMARADLLALELMVRLGECYQRRAAASG